MRASKALEALFVDYVAYYENSWLGGKLTACNEMATTGRVKHILTAAPRLSQELGGVTLHSLVTTCLLKDNDHRRSLKTLISAFEFLELVCVNMFLSPWRKEIKSLKTFTGHFVYSVQSVLPEAVLQGILENIGYTTRTPTEFLVTEIINEKEKQEFAFQIFLARMECQLILEMSNKAKTSNCLKLLNERAEIPVTHDNDKQTQATPKGHFVNGLNGTIQKTPRWSVPEHNNPSMNPEVMDSKRRVNFEPNKDGMMRTDGRHQSETTVDETLACKDKHNMEPSSDGSNRGTHVPFSGELWKTNTAYISQSANHVNSSKELECSNLSENTNMDNKDLNLFTQAENKGQNFSGSSDNLKTNSRVTRLSEIAESRSQDSQGHDPSKSERNENINSKTLSPLKSEEKAKMDIQILNPSKSSMMDKKALNSSMSAENTHTYSEEAVRSTSAEKTMKHKKDLIPSETTEDTKMTSKDHYSFTFNAERNDGSKGKSNGGSAGDNSAHCRMVPHLQYSEDSWDTKVRYNPESTVGNINNKGMHTSNLDSNIPTPECASESTARIPESTSQAAASFHSKRSESEEFLKQYSDLNIAQKPVLKDSSHQYKKLQSKSKMGDEVTVQEETTTAEVKPLRLHESKPQASEGHTEAESKIESPTKKPDFVKIFTPTDPSNKPPNVESSIPKNENATSFCVVPVTEHEPSDDEECQLASSFSKLKISEHVEEYLANKMQKTSNSEAPACIINALVHYSTPMFARSPQNNIAEGDHSANSFSKTTECTEVSQIESLSKPCIETLLAEMPSDNYRQVREPPGSSYIPPESLKSNFFNENYSSSYFKFTPQENDETHSSTETVPVDNTVFQVNEDNKEGFVVISHHMAPND